MKKSIQAGKKLNREDLKKINGGQHYAALGCNAFNCRTTQGRIQCINTSPGDCACASIQCVFL